MFKKILITIIIVLIIILTVLLVWAFIISKNSGGDITVQESLRELVSFGGSDSSSNSVFRRNGTDFITDFSNTNTDQGSGVDVSTLRLRKVASFPVAGAYVVENEDEDRDTAVRFIARENGNIFDTLVDATTQERISNTTILRIRDTFWLPGGEAFIARFLNEEGSQIESFYAQLISEDIVDEEKDDLGPTISLDGLFLPKNITSFAFSSDKEKIFYLTPNGSGSVGIISNPDGSKKVQIFDSPLSEWEVMWPDGDNIALTTKSSASIQGYLYFLNSKTEKLKKILSGIGLTTLIRNDAKKVLFTRNDAGKLLLAVMDIKSGDIIDLPIWTLAEKCIWSKKNANIVYCGVPDIAPNSNDLDRWYQGETSFSDSIWMIDIETQTANILIEPVAVVGEDIDMIKPIMSDNENYLFFINKKDSSLWQLKLEL